MRTLIITAIAAIFLALAGITACDKVEDPIKPVIVITLDTNLYPGDWADYPQPVWTANTNTNRNVLLEDYTGHRCPNCPAAAAVAKEIEETSNDRVYVVSVHAGKNGLTPFQDTASDCGTVDNPNGEFCTVFWCDESIAYGEAFGQSGFGFFANPQGTVNRISFDPFMFGASTEWNDWADQVINENLLKVDLQAQSNYYTETNGLYLHVETEFKQDLSGGDYKLVTYLLQNHTEDFQDSASSILDDYDHHNIFRGCIDGLPWGRPVTGSYTAGSKAYFDYSYELPFGMTNSDYHLIIYVYDVVTYEILQVIRHEF